MWGGADRQGVRSGRLECLHPLTKTDYGSKISAHWGAVLQAMFKGNTGNPHACATTTASGDLLVDEGGQLRLAQCANLGGGELAALEQHQRWNAADAEFVRNHTVLVDVHLGNLQAPLVSGRHLIKDGRDHAAGAAPFGPVVHQHRLVGLEDVGFKTAVGDVLDQIAGHGATLFGEIHEFGRWLIG